MAEMVAHCPACGAVVHGDPVSCARCGTFLANHLLPMDHDVAGSHETRAAGVAQGGLSRRWLAVIVAAVLVGFVAVGLAGGHPARTSASPTTAVPATIFGSQADAVPIIIHPPDPTRSVPTTLDFLPGFTTHSKLVVYAPDLAYPGRGNGVGRLTVLDLDANRLVTAEAPNAHGPVAPTGFAFSLGQGSRVAYGLGVVIVQGTDDRVWAESDRLTGPGTDLGPGSDFFAAANDPTRVWIVDGSPLQPTIREMDTLGTMIVPPRALPAGTTLVAATVEGLVLNGPQQFEVWDPVTRTIRFLGRLGTFAVAANGHSVVSNNCDRSSCSTHVTDLASGRDRILRPFVPVDRNSYETISPDGRYLAVFGTFSTRVSVFDLVNGATQLLDPGPAQYNGPFSLTWSSSSQWLFLASNADLVAYRIGDPAGFRTVTLPGRLLIGAFLAAS